MWRPRWPVGQLRNNAQALEPAAASRDGLACERPGEAFPRAVVLGVWALALGGALLLVLWYGSNIPSWDDWDIVPTLIGHQPITAEWLWSQHDEHRIPVPRLVMLAVYKLAGTDFRGAMAFNVLSMGALALACIWLSVRVRGAWSYGDAFYPLLLLNWGQAVNFLWGWSLQYHLATVLTGGALLLMLCSTDMKASLAAGGCVLLLALSGAHGVALVPFLAMPLALVVIRPPVGSTTPRGLRLALGGVVVALFAVAAVQVLTFEPVPYHPKNQGLVSIARSSFQFLAAGLGPVGEAWWPLSGWITASVLIATLTLLIYQLARRGTERRGQVLLVFLAAHLALALAIGWGRPIIEPRYVTLAVPVWCGFYLIWDICAPPQLRPWSRGLLLLLVCATLWWNTQAGHEYAARLRGALGSLEQEMQAGVPPHRLIQRWNHWLHPHQEIVADYLPMLRGAGVGAFSHLSEDPIFEEIPVPLSPVAFEGVEWGAATHTATITHSRPWLSFELDHTRHLQGIRMKFVYHHKEVLAPYVSIWWAGESEDFTPDRWYKISPKGDRAHWVRGSWMRRQDSETTMVAFMDEEVAKLRVEPPFSIGATISIEATFRLTELTLLTTLQAVPLGGMGRPTR